MPRVLRADRNGLLCPITCSGPSSHAPRVSFSMSLTLTGPLASTLVRNSVTSCVAVCSFFPSARKASSGVFSTISLSHPMHEATKSPFSSNPAMRCSIIVEPMGNGIRGITLRYSHEVRDEASYFAEIPELKLPDEMLRVAEHIVETKISEFDPAFLD